MEQRTTAAVPVITYSRKRKGTIRSPASGRIRPKFSSKKFLTDEIVVPTAAQDSSAAATSGAAMVWSPPACSPAAPSPASSIASTSGTGPNQAGATPKVDMTATVSRGGCITLQSFFRKPSAQHPPTSSEPPKAALPSPAVAQPPSRTPLAPPETTNPAGVPAKAKTAAKKVWPIFSGGGSGGAGVPHFRLGTPSGSNHSLPS